MFCCAAFEGFLSSVGPHHPALSAPHTTPTETTNVGPRRAVYCVVSPSLVAWTSLEGVSGEDNRFVFVSSLPLSILSVVVLVVLMVTCLCFPVDRAGWT